MKEKIDFSVITACGECCSGCRKKIDGICKGCIEADGYVPEWSESGRCKVHACTRDHGVRFCGLCSGFPCADLKNIIHWNPDIVEHMAELAKQFEQKEKFRRTEQNKMNKEELKGRK